MPILDSETKQSAIAGSLDPAKKPANAAGENWDSLRGLTAGVQRQHRAASVRTALFAALLILTFALSGWVLHDHLPALVNFGKEARDTVARLASSPPKPSEPTHSTALQDQRSAHKNPHSNRDKVRYANSGPNAANDPLLHPFYATVLIDGRRVFLTSNDEVVVLDIASGRWKIESEPQ